MKKRINMDLYGINRDRYTSYFHDFGLILHREPESLIVSEDLYFRLYKEFNAFKEDEVRLIQEYIRKTL